MTSAASSKADTPTPERARRTTQPVKLFAAAGALVIGFWLFVLTRWVTGPRFERVSSGPDSPPQWMKVVLNTWQVAGIMALAFCLYWFVLRPWRRDGRLSTDGLFCLSFAILSFQDPLSSYHGHWFTYNTYLVNWGSWVNDIPGWNAYGEPGRMLASPVVFFLPLYVYVWCALMSFAGALLRKLSARWPQLGTLGLITVCFAVMLVAGMILEAVILMPLGVYTYAGGPLAVNGGHYFKYPLPEAVLCAALITSVVSVRFFTNDRGETLAERGVSQLPVKPRTRTFIRFLAIVGATNLAMFVSYNVPASWIGVNSSPWPQDIQNRSYLTGHLCGPGTDRACPGPSVPLPRRHSPHLNPERKLVTGE